MSFISLRRGRTPQSEGDRMLLTADMFLGKTGTHHYLTPAELLKFVDNERLEDVQEMEAFFYLLKERLKMIGTRKKLTDRGGKSYIFQNFFRANGTEGAKVLLVGNMEQFIKDCLDLQFYVTFTLEELVNEAEKV